MYLDIVICSCHIGTVRNVTKIPLFSPNFSLTLIIYGLLSYSVRLYCANIYTPLPFFFLIFTIFRPGRQGIKIHSIREI